MARQEQDTDGDGFRDRIGYYEKGRVIREEHDADGDGRPDKVTIYDAREQVARVDEDRDGDGLVDVRSYYENGRLSRREMLEAQLGESIERRDLVSAQWSDGDGDESGSR